MLLNWLAGLRNHLWPLRQRSKITGHRRPRSPRVAQIEVLESRRVLSSVSAVSDNYQTQQDQMMMASPVVMDVLANDDSTGGALSIVSVQPPSHGSVTIQQSSGAMGYSAPDQLLYTPAFGFSGTDTFTYTASDAAGDQSTALITVTILPPAGSAGGGANGYGNGYGSNPTPPQVTGLMNNSGSTTGGASVFISGSGFSQATQVLFGNMLATSFTVNSDSSISAIAPAHAAGNVDVIVVNTTGASSITMNDQFCYQAPIGLPVVSHVSPGTETMSGGDTITVSGSGFMNATAVSFGGTVVSSFMVMSDTSILVTAPTHMAGQRTYFERELPFLLSAESSIVRPSLAAAPCADRRGIRSRPPPRRFSTKARRPTPWGHRDPRVPCRTGSHHDDRRCGRRGRAPGERAARPLDGRSP